MNDVSGFQTKVALTASNTFPAALLISQFADDSDPVDMASIEIADKAMGLNGDLIVWAKAVPLPMVLAVIPGSVDDINLQILADANRVGAGKVGAADVITATVTYPDGTFVTLANGRMLSAMFGKSVSSAGRLKTRVYAFAFQNKVGF